MDDSTTKNPILKHYYLMGITGSEAFQRIVEIEGNDSLTLSMVYKAYQQFKDNGLVLATPNSDPKTEAKLSTKKHKIKEEDDAEPKKPHEKKIKIEAGVVNNANENSAPTDGPIQAADNSNPVNVAEAKPKEKRKSKKPETKAVNGSKPKKSKSNSNPVNNDVEMETESFEIKKSVNPPDIERFCDTLAGLLEKYPAVDGVKMAHITKTDAFKSLSKAHTDELFPVFNRYYKQAVSQSKMSVETAINVVKEYASSGEAIGLHQNFPKNPLSARSLFKKDCTAGIVVTQNTPKAEFAKPAIKKKYQNLYQKGVKSYVSQLKTFLLEETGLNEKQISVVRERIKKWEKKIKSSIIVPEKKDSKSLTAFDYFVKSKSEDYVNLDPKERERKLQREFNELPEGTRQLFEGLAKANA